jgi:hypothetical protein
VKLSCCPAGIRDCIWAFQLLAIWAPVRPASHGVEAKLIVMFVAKGMSLRSEQQQLVSDRLGWLNGWSLVSYVKACNGSCRLAKNDVDKFGHY